MGRARTVTGSRQADRPPPSAASMVQTKFFSVPVVWHMYVAIHVLEIIKFGWGVYAHLSTGDLSPIVWPALSIALANILIYVSVSIRNTEGKGATEMADIIKLVEVFKVAALYILILST